MQRATKQPQKCRRRCMSHEREQPANRKLLKWKRVDTILIANHPPRENDSRRTNDHQTYVVLDFPAGVGVDGEPSLLVLRLDVGVLGRQGVLDLQAGRHTGNLAVAGVCQDSGEFHQEGRLGREQGSAPTPRGKKSPFTPKKPQDHDRLKLLLHQATSKGPPPRKDGGSILRLQALSS